jgi:predicted GH43/DUF377 family glycosyl hydrolase
MFEMNAFTWDKGTWNSFVVKNRYSCDERISYVGHLVVACGHQPLRFISFGSTYFSTFTEDFCNFDRVGATMPPENKNSAVFLVRFDGMWAMLHRPVSHRTGSKAHIWISFSPDMKSLGRTRGSSVCSRRLGWRQDRSIPATNPYSRWMINYVPWNMPDDI